MATSYLGKDDSTYVQLKALICAKSKKLQLTDNISNTLQAFRVKGRKLHLNQVTTGNQRWLQVTNVKMIDVRTVKGAYSR